MSKKQTTHTRKFLRSDARRLSPEAIEEIRNTQNNIPDAQRIMCKKHRIGSRTYQKIIDNQRPPEPTKEWRRIIKSVNISDQILEINNQKSSHDTFFSIIIQKDGIIHTEHPMDNENDTNSNSLNTVTNGQKDKVSQKKKASIKPKDESFSANKVANSFAEGAQAKAIYLDGNLILKN
ncbi:9385_t:CDS:1 [Gigaspora margarita]|uniref:9385_t:CDS:1 n=1 Tax=Gigaspora margarita TaxID=4874 RepID=A0ABM8VWH7_GIGMA|nr:9385_t:CDS:1 [Gigaspora margarita]